MTAKDQQCSNARYGRVGQPITQLAPLSLTTAATKITEVDYFYRQCISRKISIPIVENICCKTWKPYHIKHTEIHIVYRATVDQLLEITGIDYNLCRKSVQDWLCKTSQKISETE